MTVVQQRDVWSAPLLAGVVIALLLRLPIACLPGLGRDEAAYVYWSRHPELSYSPLLQLLLRPFDHGSALLQRIPALLLGLLLLWLFDRLLRLRGASGDARRLGVLALAVAPWQTLVGGVIHPDNLLMVGVLGLVCATLERRPLLVGIYAGVAVAGKLSGFLVVPAALWALSTMRNASPLGRWLGGGILLAVCLLVGSAIRTTMVAELLSFGKVVAPGATWRGPLIWLLSVLFQAGPLLAVGAIFGGAALVRRLRSGVAPAPDPRGRPAVGLTETRVTAILAASFVLVFGAAAIFNQQWKENWMFPAFVLLWPSRFDWNRVTMAGLMIATASSTLVSLGMADPSRVAALEQLSPGGYAAKAGAREARVSAASRWTERLAEYRSIEPFAAEVRRAFGGRMPRHLVSDDYGLACQLAWVSVGTEVILPRDGVFWRTVPAVAPDDCALLAVQAPAEQLWAAVPQTVELARLPHPYARALVTLALAAIEPGVPGATQPVDPLSAPFDRLLGSYVSGESVRYAAWHANAADRGALGAYVDALEATVASKLEPNAGLAFWINLYNAATLELVLSRYPVESIKEIGSTLKSPWKKKVVKVEGRELSLDEIENEVIRPGWKDARIHFALNCASIGCPPLAAEAYRAEMLDAQLDASCRRALSDRRWLALDGGVIRATKLFDWYGSDFEQWAGGVRTFAAKYAPAPLQAALADPKTKIEFTDYDWKLNQAK
ncbi:MAG: DUF547 domain-containing protein [Candidatus Eisenbacteria bacterium]|nr:DUF547 domain-containing protein [Candidatus Eisenbacteria bacterium]